MGYPSNEPDDFSEPPVAAEELLGYIERYESIEEEKRSLAGDQKEVMAEAKSRGYDVKVIKKLIALRRRDPEDVAEEEAIMEVYKSAIGMA